MNDQPAKLQPGVHLHLADVIPPNAYTYLAAFLPGLFFELSLALANPILFARIAANSPQIFPLNQYAKLGIFLFIGFVIGNAFLMFVSLVRWVLGNLYRFGFALRTRVYERVLLPAWGRWTAKRQQARKPLSWWLRGLHAHLIYFAYGIDGECREVNKYLGLLTTSLLNSRYSIKLEDTVHISDWGVFYVTLAKPTREELRGEPIMTATHAMGWCGLLAARLAPQLVNPYYLGFSGFLVLVGLIHDFYLVRNLRHPVLNGLANIRGILREFDITQEHPSRKRNN